MRVARWLVTLFGLLLASTGAAEESNQSDDARRIKAFALKSWTVKWEKPRAVATAQELVLGYGSGHGDTLTWMRFTPERESVGVLRIQFDGGRRRYTTKHPPDAATVKVQRTKIPSDVYSQLQRDTLAIAAARLETKESDRYSSSNDFWVAVRLGNASPPLVQFDWAGYQGSQNELNFGKPRAIVTLALELMQSHDFTDTELTESERAWANAKFRQDWKAFQGRQFYWWVRNRYVHLIGYVGDAATLPMLREILVADPPAGEYGARWDDGRDYQAINAVTRITKTDLRDQPVEEMDIEKTRRRVLEFLEDKK